MFPLLRIATTIVGLSTDLLAPSPVWKTMTTREIFKTVLPEECCSINPCRMAPSPLTICNVPPALDPVEENAPVDRSPTSLPVGRDLDPFRVCLLLDLEDPPEILPLSKANPCPRSIPPRPMPDPPLPFEGYPLPSVLRCKQPIELGRPSTTIFPI